MLGWRPRTPWEQGIENAVRWYIENRAWAKDIDTAELPKTTVAAVGAA
jgi:dTDP-D-glucose 4,6-dehydratase